MNDGEAAEEYAGKRMAKEMKIGARSIPLQSLKLQESFGRLATIQDDISNLKQNGSLEQQIRKFQHALSLSLY